jgi:hypothetical protein
MADPITLYRVFVDGSYWGTFYAADVREAEAAARARWIEQGKPAPNIVRATPLSD